MTIDAGDALVRALRDHNPWWEHGTAAFALPARRKSDFYHLARPDENGSQFEDQPLFGLVGRQGVGKTTLLEQFIHDRIDAGAEPERFLYLPFDANPLYQLQSAEQLRRAVRHYESRVLGRIDTDEPQFVLLDDVHRIEHPSKPTVDGWGVPVRELLEGRDDRHIIVTASADVQVERELDGAGVSTDSFDTQPILPEKFRDYIFSLYPKLETDQHRLSPTSLRRSEKSLPTALQTGDIDPLVDELQSKYADVEAHARQIQSQVVDYLAMGGTISYGQNAIVESASTLDDDAYARLRADVRHSLYQEVPGFETIQTIADLERLCALAARNAAADAFRYQDLVDLFDVDRRTLTESYLSALESLYLLTGETEYDNSRPRSIRLYLRDTGLVNALSGQPATEALDDFDREADLARVAAFDHTMRFAYNLNALHGRDGTPRVQYWRGRQGEVDFVFEVDETPVPIAMAYHAREHEPSLDATREFMNSYDTPVGFVLVGDTVSGAGTVKTLDDGVIQLPYWLYLMLC